MIASAKEFLGIGLYTPEEAAFYARVSTRTMNRWMFGGRQGDRVIHPQKATENGKLVTFLDFVQALAIRSIRSKHQVPLQKIREAVDCAVHRGIEYPFAVEHTTFLFSDEQDEGHGEVVLRIGDQLLQASGRNRGNLVMKEIAELYMRSLHFDPDTGLASEFTAWGDMTSEYRIAMNPHIQFGEPVVKPSGYSANTLWEAYEIEGGVRAASEAYGVDVQEVELALAFYDHLLNANAA